MLLNKLQYKLVEDQESLDSDLHFAAQLKALNGNNKGNTLSHPSISKYTNNPYKATSTLSFYNKLSETKVLGKFAFGTKKHSNSLSIL